MIWTCQWCGHPHAVPATNPVVYVCPKCGREAGGVFDPVYPELPEAERERVDVRVTWPGHGPDTATIRALRSLDPTLRDAPRTSLIQALRQRNFFSLGVYSRAQARLVADEARRRGLEVVLEAAD